MASMAMLNNQRVYIYMILYDPGSQNCLGTACVSPLAVTCQAHPLRSSWDDVKTVCELENHHQTKNGFYHSIIDGDFPV